MKKLLIDFSTISTVRRLFIMSEIWIYYCYPNNFNLRSINRLSHTLNSQEKTRYSKLKFDRDKFNFVTSHSLARFALNNVLGDYCRKIDVDFVVNNPPKIRNPKELKSVNISISHTKQFVVCAIAEDFNIGIDVEIVEKKDFSELYPYCLNHTEVKQVELSLDKAASFLKIWTMKEALLKGKGIGLSISPRVLECDLEKDSIKSSDPNFQDIDLWDMRSLTLSERHICSIAIKDPLKKAFGFRVKEVAPEVLSAHFENDMNYAGNN